ncbi:hypothetical protein TNCV_3266331 [Trichonephila clavipes]|nr:hypothetical protein TNCV_3266331 [Trichonephila clavipes]
MIPVPADDVISQVSPSHLHWSRWSSFILTWPQSRQVLSVAVPNQHTTNSVLSRGLRIGPTVQRWFANPPVCRVRRPVGRKWCTGNTFGPRFTVDGKQE